MCLIKTNKKISLKGNNVSQARGVLQINVHQPYITIQILKKSTQGSNPQRAKESADTANSRILTPDNIYLK